VIDRHNDPLSFYPHVPAILLFLKEKGVKIAAASRTSAPNAARQALTGLVLEDTRSGKKEGEEVKAICESLSARHRALIFNADRRRNDPALFDYQEM